MKKICKEVGSINKKLFDIAGITSDLKTFLDFYQSCINNTLNSHNGCTAQYWMKYIEMISFWLQLSLIIHEGNFDLYTFLCIRNVFPGIQTMIEQTLNPFSNPFTVIIIIKECTEDKNRFENVTMKRIKLSTFTAKKVVQG